MGFPLIPNQSLKLGRNKNIQFPNDADAGAVTAAAGRVTSPYEIPASLQLVKDLESHGIPADQLGNLFKKSFAGPRLTVAFTFHYDEKTRTSIPDQGFLRISGVESIAGLVTGDGFDVKIRLDIENVATINEYRECIWLQPLSTSSTYIFPVTQIDPQIRALNVLKTTPTATLFESAWWNNYDWKLTLSLTLLCSPIFGLDPDVPFQIAFAQEMLSDDALKDLTIVTEDGSKIKAHRCVLAAHSSVFRAMFHSGMLEAQTGILEMEGISEQGVRAFLEFLYSCGYKRNPWEDKADICVELLEAGHKYDIPHLENRMKHNLLKIPHEKFTPDSALRLAIFRKDIQHEELWDLAVDGLIAMQNEVETLPAFRKLCEEHEKSASEVFEILTSYYY